MEGVVWKRTEIWRYVPGYEQLYVVSHLGRIKRCSRVIHYTRNSWYNSNESCESNLKEIFMKTFLKNGKVYVQLRKDGQPKQLDVSKIVAQVFIPNEKNYKYVKHIDGNQTNNSVSNLRWVKTRKEVNN